MNILQHGKRENDINMTLDCYANIQLEILQVVQVWIPRSKGIIENIILIILKFYAKKAKLNAKNIQPPFLGINIE